MDFPRIRWDRIVFLAIVGLLCTGVVTFLWLVLDIKNWWIIAAGVPFGIWLAVKLPVIEEPDIFFPVPPHEGDKFDPISGETEAINAKVVE